MDLKTEIKKRADFFNTQMGKYLKQKKPETLYDAACHLPFAGGKRLRPVMAMISCESVEGNIGNVIPLSVSIELIHNFTLVHDDIMDKSKIRRNKPSVHIKYSEPTAIIAGDLLFTKAFEVFHSTPIDCKVFKNVEYGLIDCIREICEGQQLDMDFEKRHDVGEEEYLEMILKKTAVFFQYAAESGGILGDGSKDETNALNNYGKNLGLAFQIHDDYLDLSSDVETLGKDIGNDIRNGKKTLIAVHALNNAEDENKKVLNDFFGNSDATDDEIKRVYSVFNEVGSVDYARKKAVHYSEQAKKSLDVLKESDAKKILLMLADYSIKREK